MERLHDADDNDDVVEEVLSRAEPSTVDDIDDDNSYAVASHKPSGGMNYEEDFAEPEEAANEQQVEESYAADFDDNGSNRRSNDEDDYYEDDDDDFVNIDENDDDDASPLGDIAIKQVVQESAASRQQQVDDAESLRRAASSSRVATFAEQNTREAPQSTVHQQQSGGPSARPCSAKGRSKPPTVDGVCSPNRVIIFSDSAAPQQRVEFRSNAAPPNLVDQQHSWKSPLQSASTSRDLQVEALVAKVEALEARLEECDTSHNGLKTDRRRRRRRHSKQTREYQPRPPKVTIERAAQPTVEATQRGPPKPAWGTFVRGRDDNNKHKSKNRGGSAQQEPSVGSAFRHARARVSTATATVLGNPELLLAGSSSSIRKGRRRRFFADAYTYDQRTGHRVSKSTYEHVLRCRHNQQQQQQQLKGMAQPQPPNKKPRPIPEGYPTFSIARAAKTYAGRCTAWKALERRLRYEREIFAGNFKGASVFAPRPPPPDERRAALLSEVETRDRSEHGRLHEWDALVTVEARPNRGKQMSTRHDPERYEREARAAAEAAVDAMREFRVRATSIVEISDSDAARIGALEVQLAVRTSSNNIAQLVMIHSKLATRTWPCVAAIKRATKKALVDVGAWDADSNLPESDRMMPADHDVDWEWDFDQRPPSGTRPREPAILRPRSAQPQSPSSTLRDAATASRPRSAQPSSRSTTTIRRNDVRDELQPPPPSSPRCSIFAGADEANEDGHPADVENEADQMSGLVVNDTSAEEHWFRANDDGKATTDEMSGLRTTGTYKNGLLLYAEEPGNNEAPVPADLTTSENVNDEDKRSRGANNVATTVSADQKSSLGTTKDGDKDGHAQTENEATADQKKVIGLEEENEIGSSTRIAKNDATETAEIEDPAANEEASAEMYEDDFSVDNPNDAGDAERNVLVEAARETLRNLPPDDENQDEGAQDKILGGNEENYSGGGGGGGVEDGEQRRRKGADCDEPSKKAGAASAAEVAATTREEEESEAFAEDDRQGTNEEASGAEIREWFESHSYGFLLPCVGPLVEHGWDCLEALEQLTEEDALALPGVKVGHAKVIARIAARMREAMDEVRALEEAAPHENDQAGEYQEYLKQLDENMPEIVPIDKERLGEPMSPPQVAEQGSAAELQPDEESNHDDETEDERVETYRRALNDKEDLVEFLQSYVEGSGQLSIRSLRYIVRDLGFRKPDESTLTSLLAHVDVDGDGSVPPEDAIAFAQGAVAGGERLGELWRGLRSVVEGTRGKYDIARLDQQLFQKYDKKTTGSIAASKFDRAIDKLASRSSTELFGDKRILGGIVRNVWSKPDESDAIDYVTFSSWLNPVWLAKLRRTVGRWASKEAKKVGDAAKFAKLVQVHGGELLDRGVMLTQTELAVALRAAGLDVSDADARALRLYYADEPTHDRFDEEAWSRLVRDGSKTTASSDAKKKKMRIPNDDDGGGGGPPPADTYDEKRRRGKKRISDDRDRSTFREGGRSTSTLASLADLPSFVRL